MDMPNFVFLHGVSVYESSHKIFICTVKLRKGTEKFVIIKSVLTKKYDIIRN